MKIIYLNFIFSSHIKLFIELILLILTKTKKNKTIFYAYLVFFKSPFKMNQH